MEEPGKRVRHRLRLVVVVEGGRLARTWIASVPWWESSHVNFRQHGSPRILMRPAPSSTRNRSQRKSHTTETGTADHAGPRNAARNPASSSNVSQPNP